LHIDVPRNKGQVTLGNLFAKKDAGHWLRQQTWLRQQEGDDCTLHIDVPRNKGQVTLGNLFAKKDAGHWLRQQT